MIITINKKSKPLSQWAKEHGFSEKTLYGRWSRTPGRPKVFNGKNAEHFLRPRTYHGINPNEQYIVIMPDNKEMSISEIIQQPWCEIQRTAAEHRFKSADGALHRDDFKKIVRDQKREFAGSVKKELLGNEEWHRLSETENTGAGKGEIPDEVWVNRKLFKRSSQKASSIRLNKSLRPVLGDLARQGIGRDGDVPLSRAGH